jgi:TRAP-type C4-dicarboxylate transport system substrate-binding protein
MIDACYIVPLAGAAYQWFGVADNMMDVPISPVLGGIVVSQRAWNRIPERYRDELIEIADDAAEDLYYETLELEKEAIEIMVANGLKINPVSESDKHLWWDEFNKGFDLVVGKTFSREIYKAIQRHLEEYRAGHGN